MPTTRETILAALHARLQPLAALTLRDEVLPERIPTAGLIILRDGQPGEPEVTLSPLRYHYQHRAEIEAVVQGAVECTEAFGMRLDIGFYEVEERTERRIAFPRVHRLDVHTAARLGLVDDLATLTQFELPAHATRYRRLITISEL